MMSEAGKRSYKHGYETLTSSLNQNGYDLHLVSPVSGYLNEEDKMTEIVLDPGSYAVVDFLYGYPDRPGEAWYELSQDDKDYVVDVFALEH